MNALRLATKSAIAPVRAQSRSMVSRTAPVLGQQDPFEHVRRPSAAAREPAIPIEPLRLTLNPARAAFPLRFPPGPDLTILQPHLTFEHLDGATQNHFSSGAAFACTFGLSTLGVYLVVSAVGHQNRKHGFTK